MADHIYLKPLTTKSIIEILKAHPQIDAVLPTMGGQTALNLCLEADEKGIWQDFGVRMIGVDVNAINITENREHSSNYLKKLEYHLRLQKYVLPTLEVKKLHKNLVFLSDTSFLYFRGTGAASV
jgi:carbamoyl-phosphate synthase large subunit